MVDLTKLAEDGFGHWLAGFIDGEACFVIWSNDTCYSRTGRFKTKATIWLRQDEEPIVNEIVSRTGIGTILRRPARAPSNPEIIWQVQSKADCIELVRILDAFPLRARKKGDYLIWREAVQIWTTVRRTNHANGVNASAWKRMGECRTALMAGRRYREVEL